MTAEKVRTVNSANDYRPDKTSRKSERTKASTETGFNNNRSFLLLHDVINIEVVLFDARAGIALISANTYKPKAPSKITSQR